MAERNNFYRDFSNRKSFNNIPCSSDEELVPVVLTDDMKTTLKAAGLDDENIESWKFPHAKKLVKVAFVQNKKGNMEQYMKWFNSEVERYLKGTPEYEVGVLSLDSLIEDMENDDKGGYDPTGTTKFEDAAFLAMTLDMLIDDLTKLDENFGKVIRLKYDGFKKKEIQELLDLGKKKTQGYVFIDKALDEAEQLLHEYNR